jgi:nitrous oxidase accessory protein NosD
MYSINKYLLLPLSLVFLFGPAAFAAQSDFMAEHTLYVGCSEASSYSQLSDAVAAAKPHTLIKVCPGQYQGGSVSTTDHLKIQGEGKSGSAIVDCSLGGNSGIVLNGKYNWVDNLEVDNCTSFVYFGVYSNKNSNRVTNSTFKNNWNAVFMVNCDGCQVTGNKITEANTAIYDYGTNANVISGNLITGCIDSFNGGIGIFPLHAKTLAVTRNKATGCNYGYYDEYVSDSNISNNDFSGNSESGMLLTGNNTNNIFKGNVADGNGESGIWLYTPNGADAKPKAPNKFAQNTAKGNPTYDLYDATVGEGCGGTDGTCNTWDKNNAHVCYPSGICP